MDRSSPIEWRVDAGTHPFLRVVAHGAIAGLAGPPVLLVALLAPRLPSIIGNVALPVLVLVAVLLLVGGPLSLLYLLPILLDPNQRPGAGSFTGGAPWPYSLRSVTLAAVAGAVGIGLLARVGIGHDGLFAVVVGLLFSPVLVAAITTHGRLDSDGSLTINDRGVPRNRIRGVRSMALGPIVVCWFRYVRGSGLLVPRLVTVPRSEAQAVVGALRDGRTTTAPEASRSRFLGRGPRLLVLGIGASFLLVAGLALVTVEVPAVRTYVAAAIGSLGFAVLVFGWRA